VLDAGRVRFVLVEPQSGGNVGAAARALKNLGFARLVLVRPACDPLGEPARRMAVDATDVLESARSVADLELALEGALTVVATSRRVGRRRRPHPRLDRLAPELAARTAAGEVAIVFGREDRGLSDRDLDRCTHLVHFAAAESYPSFNLAQAVLLAAWELRRSALPVEDGPAAMPPPAPHEEREAFLLHLERALCAIGYLHEDSAVPVMRRLRRLIGRAGATREEVRLLRGIARRILWVTRQAARAGERAAAADAPPVERGGPGPR
jgi:tRNA/rRNA methyltransferase